MKPRFKKADVWTPGTPIEQNAYNWKDAPVHIPRSRKLKSTTKAVVDLFCGCGGFSEGFRMAGFQSALGADIHPPSLETFRQNHRTAGILMGDLREVEDDELLRALDGVTVDVLTAGVPCQGFSLNNRKRWDDDERNLLFKEFIRAVKLLKPSAIVLENVSGLRSAGNGSFRRAIADSMASAGYEVSFRILNAADYGVPQFRRRVFFVGLKNGERFRWPRPTHGDEAGVPYRTVGDAISDLPSLQPGTFKERHKKKCRTEYQRLMRGKEEVLENHKAPRHPDETIERIAATRPGEPMYESFKQRIRLHPDRPSPTQVSGGIRPQFQFGHPTQPRGLTVRERCRIQSFPDAYHIHGQVVQGRYQTGNAVPPLLAKAIATQIKKHLDGTFDDDDKAGDWISAEDPQLEFFE